MATTAKIAKEDKTRTVMAADKAANKSTPARVKIGCATGASVAAGRAATFASSTCAAFASANWRSRARFPA